VKRAIHLAVAALALSCGLVGACGGGGDGADTGNGGGAPGRAHPDVRLEGDATDAALEALLAAEPIQAPPRFARIDAPAEGTVLTTRPTFTWTIVPKSASVAPAHDRRLAAPSLEFAPRTHSIAREWLALVGPERSAFAAPPAFTGTGYLLAVNDHVGVPIVRVFTSKTSYTPDDEAWAILRAHTGKAISAWVMSADFEVDALAPDGGPFPGPWIALSVSPDAK
jgi:hypothetical protein